MFLLFDPLDRNSALPARDARRFVRRMFRAQYGLAADHPYIRRVTRSFRDDPVRLRGPVYTDAPAAAGREIGRWLRPIKMVISERHSIHHLRERGYHGNGSQDIFYRRSDVYTLSIHGTPNLSYPHFAGFDDERGEGEGKGFNRNYPLRRGVDDARYLEVLDEALRQIRRFRADFLVLSLGFDIMRGDPTGSFLVTVRGMRSIGVALGRHGIPMLVVQEGGYSVVNLRQGARAFFSGLGSTWY